MLNRQYGDGCIHRAKTEPVLASRRRQDVDLYCAKCSEVCPLYWVSFATILGLFCLVSFVNVALYCATCACPAVFCVSHTHLNPKPVYVLRHLKVSQGISRYLKVSQDMDFAYHIHT
jgi:hypothetical protein